jgi:hypothetical protein
VLSWLIGIAVFIVLWGALWKSQPKAAFGVLFGLFVAWILSFFVSPYVTGMEKFPVWLAPLPILCIVIVLFIFGTITWLRADKLPPPRVVDDEHGHADDAHGHH